MSTDLNFDNLPPAEFIEADSGMVDNEILGSEDIGQCTTCGKPVHRPAGASPTGRKLRIPKYCSDCKTTPVRKTSSGKAVRRSRSNVDIAEGVAGIYTSIGLVAFAKGDKELGLTIIGQKRLQEMMSSAEDDPDVSVATSAGEAWAKVAAANPKVNDFITKLLETSVWTDIATAHMPLGMLMIQRKPKSLGRIRAWVLRRRVRKAGGNA